MPKAAVALVLESLASAALRHPWALGHWCMVSNILCPQLKHDGEDMRYDQRSGAMVHQTLLCV